ncbi:MAG: hypothetical protein E7638_07625 [Ruminococcaceae bacterium]|nr:hypothetical protein [Oscillospiraceae bacterium]
MLGNSRVKKPAVFLLDLVYMVFLTVGVSLFAYGFNYGDHRLFILLSAAVGFALYHNTVGRVVIFFSEAIVRLIRAVIHYVLVVPLRFLFRVIRRCGMWLIHHTVWVLLRIIGDMKRSAYTERTRKKLKKLIRI